MKYATLKVTAYERAIIVLMARGYRPKEIAAALGKTARLVCQARRRVFDRNGIKNDTQLGMAIERSHFLSLGERQLIEDRRQAVLKARELQ